MEATKTATEGIFQSVLFWVRGLEVRHGRAKQTDANLQESKAAAATAGA